MSDGYAIPADEQAIYDEYKGQSWFPHYGPRGEAGGSSGHSRAGGLGPIMPHVYRRVPVLDPITGSTTYERLCVKCGETPRRHR